MKLKENLKKRFIIIKSFLFVIFILGFISSATHQASEVLVDINGKEMTLQRAY